MGIIMEFFKLNNSIHKMTLLANFINHKSQPNADNFEVLIREAFKQELIEYREKQPDEKNPLYIITAKGKNYVRYGRLLYWLFINYKITLPIVISVLLAILGWLKLTKG